MVFLLSCLLLLCVGVSGGHAANAIAPLSVPPPAEAAYCGFAYRGALIGWQDARRGESLTDSTRNWDFLLAQDSDFTQLPRPARHAYEQRLKSAISYGFAVARKGLPSGFLAKARLACDRFARSGLSRLSGATALCAMGYLKASLAVSGRLSGSIWDTLRADAKAGNVTRFRAALRRAIRASTGTANGLSGFLTADAPQAMKVLARPLPDIHLGKSLHTSIRTCVVSVISRGFSRHKAKHVARHPHRQKALR